MDPLHLQTILLDNGGDGTVGDGFVPDAKGGGGATNIGFGEASGGGGKSSRAYAGVDADADLLVFAGEGLADAFELRDGAAHVAY